MAVTRVNSAIITGTGTTASAYTTTFGVATQVGDLIVVMMNSNGTHATNGMACSDAVNGAYTTLSETQQGNASSRWGQTFWKVATGAGLTTTVITATPYASNTASRFVVDVFRGTAGTISEPVVTNSGATGTTATGPALAAAPTAGDLVCALGTVSSGTMTPPSPFVVGSSGTTNVSCYSSYVLSASGSSTYGGTWTIGTSNSSAEQAVAFAQSGAAASANPRALMARQVAVLRSSVI